MSRSIGANSFCPPVSEILWTVIRLRVLLFQNVAMWMQLLTLALASYCLAAPQQQQVQANDLDSLINSVFNTEAPQPAVTNPTTSGTYTGTKNNPPPLPDDCTCVAYYQCLNNTVITDGIGLIDIRSDFGNDSTPDKM